MFSPTLVNQCSARKPYSLLDMYELKLAEVTTIRQKTISPISWVSPKPLLASSQTIKIGCGELLSVSYSGLSPNGQSVDT